MIAAAPSPPSMSLSPAKAFFFVQKAREFDIEDEVTDLESDSSGSDDVILSLPQSRHDDPRHHELRTFISALTEDEQIDLVALTWLGRGDGDVSDWDELRAEAARLHNNRTAQYLLGKPMLAEQLEEGLAQLGFSAEDYER